MFQTPSEQNTHIHTYNTYINTPHSGTPEIRDPRSERDGQPKTFSLYHVTSSAVSSSFLNKKREKSAEIFIGDEQPKKTSRGNTEQ